MKKFLQVFLGSMAAIWVSVGLLFLGFFVLIVASIASSFSSGNTPAKIQDRSILYIDLSKEVTDRPTVGNIFDELQGGSLQTLAVNNTVLALDAATKDKRIEGAYIYCGGGSAGQAQAQEIINALKRFKQADKWVYAYGDNYTQDNYFIASVADSVFLNPIGGVDLHGLSATTLYFRQLLEKVGIEAQVVKVGTYKSAVEPFMLDSMSEPSRLQQQVYLGNIWKQIAGQIAKNRGLSLEKVNAVADTLPAFMPAEFLLKEKLVDRLAYRHEVDEMLKEKTDHDDLVLISPDEYCKANDVEKIDGGGDKTIAVLYAVGNITENGEDGIASEKLVPEILDLAENEDIDGLILRVNSGGGSAFASEQIWEALEQFKKISKKPYYVSMGDVAASGGYYISCGANKIYAEAVTLTGSIGIFGIIPSAKKLINDLGVNTGTVATNPKGSLPTLMDPMTPIQRAAMQGYVDRGYDLFTKRVAEGRHISQDSVKVIAEGRVWDGQSALNIGLVDKLGGLDTALRDMAAEIGAENGYEISEFPSLKFKWWEEILSLDTQLKAWALGESYPLYQSLESVRNMSVLQCRMDFITLE